jgi:GDP-fucose protein O-fucosyltransferase
MKTTTLSPNEPSGRKIRLREVLLLLLAGSVLLNVVLIARLQHREVNQTLLGTNTHESSLANLPNTRQRRRRDEIGIGGSLTKKPSTFNAPLRCEPFGGPFNQSAVDDIVYWRDDIAKETQFRSVFLPDAAKNYFVFEPDEAGFSNVRLSFETVVAFAVAMGRTLVMPPKLRLAQLLHPHEEGVRAYSYYDFFNIRNVPIISMQKYLETVALTGQLHNEAGEDSFPPYNRTKWDGLLGNSGNSGVGEAPLFFQWLSTSMHALDWKRDECIVAFPVDRSKGVRDVRAFLKSILDEDDKVNNGMSKRITSYTGHPIPVDSSPRDRFREMLSERRTLCEYDDYWQQSESLYLTGHEATGKA